jgi:hypothetical protein
MLPTSVERTLQELGLHPDRAPSPADWRRFLAAQADAERAGERFASLARLTANAFDELHRALQLVAHNAGFLDDAVVPMLRALGAYRGLLERSATARAPPHAAEVDELARRADLDFLASEIPVAAAQSLTGLSRAGAIVRALASLGRHPEAGPVRADLSQVVSAALVLASPHLSQVAEVRADLAEQAQVAWAPGDLAHAVLDVLDALAQGLPEVGEDGAPRGSLSVKVLPEQGFANLDISAEPVAALPVLPLARALIEARGGTLRIRREGARACAVQARLPLCG